MSDPYEEGRVAAMAGDGFNACPYRFEVARVAQPEFNLTWRHKLNQWFRGWSDARKTYVGRRATPGDETMNIVKSNGPTEELSSYDQAMDLLGSLFSYVEHRWTCPPPEPGKSVPCTCGLYELTERIGALQKRRQPKPRNELCEKCGGNGVIQIPGGVSECPQCQGRCWA